MFRSAYRSIELTGSLAVLGLLLAFPARGEATGESPAHVLSARVGRTAGGVPRVVFETDRPVQFLTVELPQGNGFEVHLLGTDTTAVPAATASGDDVVQDLELRAGPSGV